jgi:hypothetical protein
MKKILFLFTILVLTACGGSSEDTTEQRVVSDTTYAKDHEWMVGALELKEKFAQLNDSWLEIGNKEVEETICGENAKVEYKGKAEEMNLYLLTTYMLANFAADDFGQFGFNMPEAMIRDVTPLSELNWMNFSADDKQMFELYRKNPELNELHMDSVDAEMVEKPFKAVSALKEGMLALIAITDYLPPKTLEGGEPETGYVMGYVMYADWENGSLSCISPFLAQNSSADHFVTVEGSEASAEDLMKEDLKEQTYSAIDSITRLRSGFSSDIQVNPSLN